MLKKRSHYIKILLKSFNKLINESISEVYFLFISSIYYNYDIRKEVIKTLSSQRINCIFYSLKKDLFYLNFKDNISDIKLINSYMLIPTSNIYTNQEALDNTDFEKEEGIYNKYNKNLKNKKEEFEKSLIKEFEEEEKKETNKKKKKRKKKKEEFELIFFYKRKQTDTLQI